MDTFNLKEAADQSLRLLGQSGVGVKAVKEYQTTGLVPSSATSPVKASLT